MVAARRLEHCDVLRDALLERLELLRVAALRAQARAALGRHLAAQIAHEVDVLVERDGVSGHAADFTRVRLDAPRERGTIARARVSAAAADHLIARIS